MLRGNETEALLQNLICSQIEKNYPFAIYRLPNKDEISVVAQNSSNIYTLQNLEGMAGESGFLIAPFTANDRTPVIWIRPDITDLSFFQNANKKNLRVKFERGRKLREMTKKRFSRYLQYARRAIKSGKIEKVVIARAIHMPAPENFNLAAFFLKICDTYEWSFVNLFFIPGKGIWAGASPELLLGYSQGEFTTYSLAGTLPKYQLKKQKQKWTLKEKKEQEIVSSYIKQVVSAYPEVKLMLAGPETVEAGNIIHLRTIFSIKNIPHFYWTELVEALHPTPAVAGFPKEKAIQIIENWEGTNRAYYCGYLGPVNIGEEINLYVNLRCMEMYGKKLIFHAGCGITEDSESEKEWEETKLKLSTLMRFIHKT